MANATTILKVKMNNEWIEIPAIVGPRGTEGPQGPIGPIGPTPNIGVGSVVTLDAGDDAEVSVSGTSENPLFNFLIPKNILL